MEHYNREKVNHKENLAFLCLIYRPIDHGQNLVAQEDINKIRHFESSSSQRHASPPYRRLAGQASNFTICKSAPESMCASFCRLENARRRRTTVGHNFLQLPKSWGSAPHRKQVFAVDNKVKFTVIGLDREARQSCLKDTQISLSLGEGK